MPQNSKIIFPSTHVIFDGLKKTKLNINENEKPIPSLAYSKSKYQNEKDIIASGRNYVILRLASVYGYSGDTTRIQIVPNLFSKMTSQNQTIKIFSGGKQIKNLVPLKDVARCFEFMEKNEIKNQTFNLSKDTLTIKKLANMCKKINPNIKIISSNDEIPNLGYSLSNKKLLNTGFSFLYNLKDSLNEMISNWTKKNENLNIEYKYKGVNEYKDYRGLISNYELTESINLIGYIESKKGTHRANHFHPVQEQKCLIIKGQFISIIKNLLNDDPSLTKIINAGEMVVTKPNVAHVMLFTKDTVFLNLIKGDRDHEKYGITHTIPYKLIEKHNVKEFIRNYQVKCRVCDNTDLTRVLSLGYLPLANNLLKNEETYFEKYPLELNYCKICFNCQLSYTVNPKKLFKNYLYLSSTSKFFMSHFEMAAKKYEKLFKLSKQKSLIIDIGSNDGIALLPFKKIGYKNILGIEPAINIAKIANQKGIRTINDFFNAKTVKKIKQKADLILASNVFAHTNNIKDIVNNVKKVLSQKGVFIIEVQYLLRTLKDGTFDNIYHEHVNYWSLLSIDNFFTINNMNVYNAEEIKTHGGSLRVYVTTNLKKQKSKKFKKIIEKETRFGLKNVKIFKKFEDKIFESKNNFLKNLKNIRGQIHGYGAPAKCTTLLNFFGITNEINTIFEDNKLKIGKFIPGTKIKIAKKTDKKVENLIVFAWNFYDQIKKENKKLYKKIYNIKTLLK
jgi:SAM-dependent methyltransferase